MMSNQELKQYMKKRKIYQWRVAEALEIQESALSKQFRHEIDEEYKKIIIAIIDELYEQDNSVEHLHSSEPIKKKKSDMYEELFKALEQ